jgi:hypothetical protein
MRTGPSFVTFTGKTFHPFDPDPDDICIEDIAHALSNICRYNGHSPVFCSVADHSILVSRILKTEGYNDHIVLAGLLHDASEAYLCDLNKWLKTDPRLAEYKEAEYALNVMIGKKFEVDFQNVAVKWADNEIYDLEQLAFNTPWTPHMYGPNNRLIKFREPEHAETAFLEEFEALTKAIAASC